MFSFRKDKRSFAKKLMNDIQNREKEESEIITIGKITPERQQKREVENTSKKQNLSFLLLTKQK